MDHPNAIYFIITGQLVFAILGGLFVAGSFGRGPWASTNLPNWALALIGWPNLLLGLYVGFGNLARLLNA